MGRRFVVDNSIVMTWCFRDEANLYADAVLKGLVDDEAVVPSIWPLEVVDLLLLAERRNWLHESDSMRFLSLLSRLPIYVERAWPEEMMKQLLGLGRDGWLSSFDAAYLDLAMRQGLSIATLDDKLLEAARRVGVAPYVVP